AAGGEMAFLPPFDMRPLLRAEAAVTCGWLVPKQPGDRPGEAQHARDDECQPPALRHHCPCHQRRRDHRAERRTDIVDTAGNATLAGWKPLRDQLLACRLGGSFG